MANFTKDAEMVYHEQSPLPLDSLTGRSSLAASIRYSCQFLGKRLLDFTLSAIACVLLSPLMLLIGILIRLDSTGPALYYQRRLGLGGRTFWIWKFRTMVADAEDQMSEMEPLNESPGGVLFKMRDDPRITRMGRFLRRTSLDELPQLFNVLGGQMSLVGPRPLPLRDSALLQEIDEPRFRRRLGVLPGLTGPWQIAGGNSLGFRYMLDCDIYYIDNWSLQSDLVLIASTFVGILARPGAC
jgi:lipopolysaccharide/colanic/teichoic acid biosynthesis glycosyltransferase